MARHRRKGTEGSLDSLMDTMTNVVGILVILMAFTQIGVGDAVRRILRASDAPLAEVTPEAINAARDQQAELEKTLREVAFRWESLQRNLPGQQASLTRIQKVVEDLRKELVSPLEDNVSRSELEQRLAEQKKEAEELNAKVIALETELEALKSKLAGTPDRPPVEAKFVTLPNPRAAPPNREALVMFCRDGRVYPVFEDRLQAIGTAGVQQARPAINADGQHDCRVITEFFAKHRKGDAYFRLRVEVHNFAPYLVLNRLPDAGETVEELMGPNSGFREMLEGRSQNRHYLSFRVWPDSFEVYTAARNIADEMGWAAGWEPQTRGDEWKIRLDGDIVCTGKTDVPKPPKQPKVDDADGEPLPQPPVDEEPIDFRNSVGPDVID